MTELTAEQKRVAYVRNAIDRLMAPGVKLAKGSAAWLTVQRDKLHVDPAGYRVGGGIRDRVRRMMIEAGFEQRRALGRAARRVVAEPRATSPASLYGPTAPTPMADWLVTGRPVPVALPHRRRAVSA